MKNPIYVEYYSHEKCNCYKINLPHTSFKQETIVLCPVSEGYKQAQTMALGILVKHTVDAIRTT